jgi:hypothetical protein
MKFENLMLHSLFATCLLACGLIFSAMLSNTPPTVQLASNIHTGIVLSVSPAVCALPADGVVCPRSAS